jgi:hypothetical protein
MSTERSMKQLTRIPDASLPRLAWCAVLDANGGGFVHHGAWIEVRDSAFVEGAWSTPFDTMEFPSAHTFTGSGGVLTRDGVLFATPTHNVEPLYALRAGRRLHGSNSLRHVLASADDDLDPTYLSYDVEISFLVFGTKGCPSRIRTRRGSWIDLYRCCNVQVDANLAVAVLPKAQRGPFQNYADYRAFLGEQVALTIENSADPRRAVRYTPLSTLSSGYDSAAAAVVARAAGCREYVTFSTASDASDDSGRPIGDILRLEGHEYDPERYRQRSDLAEAEFAATGGGGGSVILTASEDRLCGRILVTGHYGGEAWDCAEAKGGGDMPSADAAGGDLIYFRTRVGFLHLAVPSIGYSEFTSLQRIAKSDDMRPWRLERDRYDRPIPRRILETAGVPRELFGQHKKFAARSLKYCNPAMIDEPDLTTMMAPASYRHFSEWRKQRRLYSGQLDRMAFASMHTLHRFNMRVSHKPWAWIPIPFKKPRTPHRLLLHWGMEQIKPRYSASHNISSSSAAAT